MLRNAALLIFSVLALLVASVVFATPSSSQTLRVSDTTITLGSSVTFTATECGGGLGGDYQVTYTVTAPDASVQTLTTSQTSTFPGQPIPHQNIVIGTDNETLPGIHRVDARCDFIELGSSQLHNYGSVSINIINPVPDTQFDLETPNSLLPDTGAGSGGGAGGAGGSGGSGSGLGIGFTG